MAQKKGKGLEIGDRVHLRCDPSSLYTVIGFASLPAAHDGKYPEEHYVVLRTERGDTAYWKEGVLSRPQGA